MNLFPMNHYFAFKCSTGHLVPVEWDLLNPGERINMRVDMAVKLNSMVTPAMMDLRFFIDYFFVPMDMLYQTFGREWSQTKEYFSSIPSFNADSAQQNGLPIVKLGNTVQNSDGNMFVVNYNNRSSITYQNTVARNNGEDNVSFERWGDRIARLMDYFGNDGMAVTLQYNTHTQGDEKYQNAINAAYNPYHFPWYLLAYNAAWEYWYRLEDRSAFDSRFFNLDRWQIFEDGSRSYMDLGLDLFGAAVKYAPMFKDYFTSVFKAPVINFMNLAFNSPSDFDETSIRHNEQYLDPYTDGSFVNNRNRLSTGTSYTTYNFQDGSNISLQDLRIAKAREKYLNILGRLPRKNYDNLVYALFGKQVPHDVKHDISHLGQDTFGINVNQITALASTEQAPLGEFGGSAQGVSRSKGVKFTAPCHGVVIAIAHAKPKVMYFGGVLSQNIISDYNQLYNPVYDNLGMEPVFAFELASHLDSLTTAVQDYSQIFNSIFGWKFRYSSWKQRYNRSSKAFHYGTERSWFITRDLSQLSIVNQFNQNGIQQQAQGGATAYQFNDNNMFYTSPMLLNDIMVVSYGHDDFDLSLANIYDSTYSKMSDKFFSRLYSTDPFICLAHIDYSKFSKMSKHSLVQFD